MGRFCRPRSIPMLLVASLVIVAGSGAMPGDAAVPAVAARVAPDLGTAVRISGTSAIAYDDGAAVAWSEASSVYLVVWTDQRNLATRGRDIYGRLVGADGVPSGAEFRISGAAATADETGAAVAWDGQSDQFLVVWEDRRNYAERGIDIYGHLVGADGVPSGGDFRISSGTLSENELEPVPAWNSVDGGYLVVWSDSRNYLARGTDIYGRMVGSGGSRLGPGFRVNGSGATGDDGSPAIAWNGSGYLVVWSDGRDVLTRGRDTYGRRVAADGSRVGHDFRIVGPGGTDDEFLPAVTWSAAADRYLVVWSDGRNQGTREYDIYGRIVAGDGSRPSADFRVCGPGALEYDGWPSVGPTGSGFLVAWQDHRNGPYDLYGRRVASDGSRPEGDFRISPAGTGANQVGPVLAWHQDLTEYLVAWLDARFITGLQVYGRLIFLS